VALDTIEHDTFPKRKQYLRAATTALVKYKQEAEVGEISQTKVTWTQQVDLGGRIPKWAQNRQGVEQLMYAIKNTSYTATLSTNTPSPRQVFKHDAEALRQEPGDGGGEQPAPGDHGPEPRRAVH
jgi:hypothetical protein